MFKIQLADQEDLTISCELVDVGRGVWSKTFDDPGNFSYAFEGFDGEDRITLFVNPMRESWEAVLVMQRTNSGLVMCRVGAPDLESLIGAVNATLNSWENF